MKVYKAIANVAATLSKEGISKDRKNQQQGYQFRGIDDVYNALSTVLADNDLVILPRMISREVVERQTKQGGALFYVTVEAEFDFVSAEDGSKHTVKTFGEAMDSGDKATNKAMSAAYKYCAMQTFCIPTEGDNDADATTHEVIAKGLPSAVLKRHTDAIAAAQNMDELKAAYTAAYKAAHAVKDTVAEEVLAEAKDNRKIELEGVAA
ncbi:single-stranded DNA-binding protein [Burkholderia multivorans]|uniref:ERF family protein n=1 Tax=Burkholderia multivorans TaxID=87883 RepID=UPI0007535A0C|nr:ERF family protein [Burkholderia multivorans]KVV22342.1 single-stranded DNA-binding protein [Burkholderia multivorans]MBU9203081.1 ERF family protein [Burkholderia multivorans]MCA8385320.1 ERF family protein [Burkholderia multivorans]